MWAFAQPNILYRGRAFGPQPREGHAVIGRRSSTPAVHGVFAVGGNNLVPVLAHVEIDVYGAEVCAETWALVLLSVSCMDSCGMLDPWRKPNLLASQICKGKGYI
uniref:Uncharacterized protein n=1 Tax=Ascaris lumbricoides TaxID=6252 RepID=A0A0M3HRD6_ASCLU